MHFSGSFEKKTTMVINGTTGIQVMIAGAAGTAALVGQVVIDSGTLIPAGVAVVAMCVLVRVTWKLAQVHTQVLQKITELEEKHLRNANRILNLQRSQQDMIQKLMDKQDISYHGLILDDEVELEPEE